MVRIELEIHHIVSHGAGPVDERALQADLAAEITRHVQQNGLPAAWKNGMQVDSLRSHAEAAGGIASQVAGQITGGKR
jgi:hypothetical protein